jgi:hypothetical protein
MVTPIELHSWISRRWAADRGRREKSNDTRKLAIISHCDMQRGSIPITRIQPVTYCHL